RDDLSALLPTPRDRLLFDATRCPAPVARRRCQGARRLIPASSAALLFSANTRAVFPGACTRQREFNLPPGPSASERQTSGIRQTFSQAAYDQHIRTRI